MKIRNRTKEALQGADDISLDITAQAVKTLRDVASGIESGKYELNKASWEYVKELLPLQMLVVQVVDKER